MSLDREEVIAKVDSLYRFRDLYFEEHPLSQAEQKPIDVEKKMNEALLVVEQNQTSLKNKAEYLLLKAKCLNVKANFDEEAEEAMSKAVKLDPKQVEAWNILGECFWKKGDIDSAKNCFSGALQHSKDKVTLRNLSMVLRQFGSSREEKLQYITESVSKAKEAVNLDITDGTSWFVLGNAYLSQFFGGTQNEQTLQQCLKAYTQAEKDAVAKHNPDLYYNRSMCYLYQSDFKSALINFKTASQLDPSWDLPIAKANMVRDYLRSTSSMLSNMCGLLGKNKLQKIMSSITDDDLGPYSGGSYTSPSGKTLALKPKCLNQLSPGSNAGIVINGKVIGGLSTDAAIPYTFFLVDSKENCIAVCLYNVSNAYGVKTADSIAIPEPYVMSVGIESGEGLVDSNEMKYNFIRVATPMVMVVNGKKLGIDKQAPTVLKVTALSE
ncbi:tetratricopeptide repeat protein 5-like [Watersipora subatra]|uniref:tetratricopeptide repeat protein 5-like n=1 Tax=Watersipora subatra TaxID=2589382 RepID=UPI00355BC127